MTSFIIFIRLYFLSFLTGLLFVWINHGLYSLHNPYIQTQDYIHIDLKEFPPVPTFFIKFFNDRF